MFFPPLALDVFTLTLWKTFIVVRLLTSKVFLRELHLKQTIVFSDIIGHLSSSICSAPLTACPVPDCGLSHLHGLHGEHYLTLKLSLVYSNHVNRSNILLPKLTSFHLAARLYKTSPVWRRLRGTGRLALMFKYFLLRRRV